MMIEPRYCLDSYEIKYDDTNCNTGELIIYFKDRRTNKILPLSDFLQLVNNMNTRLELQKEIMEDPRVLNVAKHKIVEALRLESLTND